MATGALLNAVTTNTTGTGVQITGDFEALAQERTTPVVCSSCKWLTRIPTVTTVRLDVKASGWAQELQRPFGTTAQSIIAAC